MTDSNKRIKPWIVAAGAAAAIAGGYGLFLLTSEAPVNAAAPVTVTVVERIPAGAQAKRKAVARRPAPAVGSPEDLARRYQVPVTETQPVQGPADALVTMVTWCDFRSQLCRDADPAFKAMMKKYKGKLRWVFRHAPTEKGDMAAHLFAQSVAYHEKSDAFWRVRELLLKASGDHPLTTEELGDVLGKSKLPAEKLLSSGSSFAAHVDADLRFGDQFGVVRPMGVFVNGKRLAPSPASELGKNLDQLISLELEHATRLVMSGTPREQVYATLTKPGYWGLADDPEARRAAEAEATAAKEAAPANKEGSGVPKGNTH